MEKWLGTCLLLCLIGFLKELRPSEPFVTEFLVGEWKNFTIEEVMQDIYPVWTYSYFALLFVIFIITDLLLYKPIIIFEGMSLVITWCLLIWGQGIPAMQAVEFMYAAATASRIAYSTYIYTQVPVAKFQIVTAYTKASLLSGRCLAGLLGQILIATNLCDYNSLNYISLAFVLSSTLVAFYLPSVNSSIYFHRSERQKCTDKESGHLKNSNELDSYQAEEFHHVSVSLIPNVISATDSAGGAKAKQETVFQLFRKDFTTAFSDTYTLKWSLWWAFATCGFFQVVNYIQPLWETLSTAETSLVYNGGVEAVHSLLGALSTLAIGYVSLNWSVFGEPIIAIISLFEGGLLFMAGSTNKLWVTYIAYIAFGISYRVLITIASAEVAKGLKRESYGFIFGFNTFIALLFQSILTIAVSDGIGLALDPQTQFKIYGGYFGVLGAVFSLMAAYNIFQHRSKACTSKSIPAHHIPCGVSTNSSSHIRKS